MSKSLVTGACGFIGSHMVDILHEAGHEIVATDLPAACEKDDRTRGRYPSLVKAAGANLIPCDLTQKDTLKALPKDIDYVFHIAAIFNYSTPYDILRRVNVDGTCNLLDTLMENGGVKRFVNWGAAGVYDPPDGKKQLPITEEWPVKPSNNYLRSKWEQEVLVREYFEKHKLPSCHLRPAGVYGSRGVYGGGQLLMQTAKMKSLAIPRNFTFRMPFVHARDVARAALFIGQKEEALNQSYNLDDTHLNNVEFMQIMAEETGRQAKLLPPVPVGVVRTAAIAGATVMGWWAAISKTAPALEKDSTKYFGRDYWYSNEKLKKLGFTFEYPDVRKGIHETLEWYRDNGYL